MLGERNLDKEKLIEKVTSEIIKRLTEKSLIPSTTVGVSNRHIHINQEDLEVLFGKGYELTKLKALKQPGQFAAKETVIAVGPKGTLEKIRILGPVRKRTQLEISKTDAYSLGIKVPIRESGDTENTPGIEVIGPKSRVKLDEGVIIAKRHIHIPPSFAAQYGLSDKELVTVRFEGKRGLEYGNVVIRISDKFVNEMHIDTDEANAGDIRNGDIGIIVKG